MATDVSPVQALDDFAQKNRMPRPHGYGESAAGAIDFAADNVTMITVGPSGSSSKSVRVMGASAPTRSTSWLARVVRAIFSFIPD